ncbi:hypothetical protein FOC1_g10001355 [Fusarium oxysporum f. sp. cubense race 1]|uniref:Uncharacterized protein n=1 Tax=Fusarium oxysporum f. sp. cubense (strain race 1) TaxID=1229664 RepID=N4UWY6_FUSC1|nr:hypothetical protein FOC1_g10001355 [Fusarium oxysporum f. sp. cubense race 1]
MLHNNSASKINALFASATIPFMAQTSDDVAFPLYLDGQLKPFGFSSILISNTSAAAIDAPLPNHFLDLQRGLKAVEAYFLSANKLRGTVVNNNPTIQDAAYWNSTFPITNPMRFGLGNGYYFAVLQQGVAGDDSAQSWNGSWALIGTMAEQDMGGDPYPATNKDMPFQNAIEWVKDRAMRFDVKRHSCSAKWIITRNSIELQEGKCDPKPLSISHQLYDNGQFALASHLNASLSEYLNANNRWVKIALTRPDLESTNTGENEHLLSREDESGQQGSLQQFSRHVDQSSLDVCTETHELQQWRSTIKNTRIDETQILLEAETEDAGLTSPLAQESNVNKPQQEEVYQVASTHSEQKNTTPQDYDINTSTRLQYIIGVFTGCLLALACIGSGIYVLATKKEKLAMHVNIDTTAREVLSLVLNIILTFCIDSMAFVHSVSLRWALYSEHQLEFNTNLRLFTSSTKSGPNRCYLLLPGGGNEVFINGFALLILGLALLGHASLSTWCLWTSSDSVLTWSSNPLSNCLAAVQNGLLQRRNGRLLAILWMFAILGLDLAYAADNGVHCPPGTASLKWEMMGPGGCSSNMASLSMRKGPKGSLLASDSLKNAVSSWEYIILSIFKSLLHWSVGQALQPSMETEITDDMSTMDPALVKEELAMVGVTFFMIYTRLLLYAVLAILLASFATFFGTEEAIGTSTCYYGPLANYCRPG